MNPLLAVRAAGGLALPVAAILAARDRRSARTSGDSQSSPLPVPRRGLSRRACTHMVRDGGDLRDVDLRGADLAGLDLSGRDLSGLDLSGARLRGTNLSDCVLRDARFDFADLTMANLRDTDLDGASLLEADLHRADLRGAQLGEARQLTMANLRRARFDRRTQWPLGLDPRLAGALLVS